MWRRAAARSFARRRMVKDAAAEEAVDAAREAAVRAPLEDVRVIFNAI